MSWQEREAARFDSGEYKLVPWRDETFWRDAIGVGGAAEFHFTHVSRADSSLVAFTPDAAKGEADRQVRVKPGRYLARFFPELHANVIKHWSGRYAAENETPVVLFASTPDEIEASYTSGPVNASGYYSPASCMSGKVSAYSSAIHPTRVYGAGDLSVAYLRDGESVTARSIVWPEKKLNTRIYGDVPRLSAALESLGYRSGKFIGARLLKVPSGDGYVLPYIDYHNSVSIGAEFLTIVECDGELECGETCGVASSCGAECEECGTRGRSPSFHSGVEQTLCEECAEGLYSCNDCSNYTRYPIFVVDASICENCIRQNYTCCEDCEEYSPDSCISSVESRAVCDGCISDYHFCEECNEYRKGDICNEHDESGDDDESGETEAAASVANAGESAAEPTGDPILPASGGLEERS